NALLKTLEEPPGHVVFILCTTDPQKVPETIHSRCQRFDFRRIAPESMVSRLGAICIAENVQFEGEALDLIAHRAEGGLRNALTSLEQIIAFENGKVTLAGAERLLGAIDSNDMAEIMSYVGRRDIANCFRWTSRYVETGADLAQFVRDMSEHVRNLYVMALVGDDVELEVSETARRELAGELEWFGPDRASRLLGVLGDLSAELKTSSNPRLAFEIALTRMVRPDSDLTLESLAERIEALESGYSSVAHVMPGPARESTPLGAGPSADSSPATAPAPAPDLPATLPVRETHAASDARWADSASPAGEGTRQASEEAVSAAAPQGASHDQPPSMQQDAAANQPGSPNPSSKAASAAPTAASPLENPAALQRIWQATLAGLKKRKQAHVVLFLNAKARFDAATGTVRIVFPAESDFLFKSAQKPDVQDALAASFNQAAGFPVAFAYEKAGEPAVVAAQVAAPAQPHVDPSQQPQAQAQPQAEPEAQPFEPPELQPQAQPEAQAEMQPQAQAQPQAEMQTQAQVEAQGRPQVEAVAAYDDPPYDDYAYDDPPYDDEFYDPAPYGDSPSGTTSAGTPADSTTPAPATDAQTTASPDDSGEAERADLQAMLQAGFGAGVVFSEVED
ncbi:MAG TPA: DNA polymerase III subunit gamma/tau, partial [Eggerthellaceae bacterium]|nr:DNA polymerase III subunit gamma/tau [Eggerthellaceae bacterium]